MAETDQSWYSKLDFRGKDGQYSPGQQLAVRAMGSFAEILGARVVSGEQGAIAAANRQADRDKQLAEQRFAMFQQMQQQAYQTSERNKDRQHEMDMLQKQEEIRSGETYQATERELTGVLNATPELVPHAIRFLPPEQQEALGADPKPEQVARALRTQPHIVRNVQDARGNTVAHTERLNKLGVPAAEYSGMSDTELADFAIEEERTQQGLTTALGRLNTELGGITNAYSQNREKGTPRERRNRILQTATELQDFTAKQQAFFEENPLYFDPESNRRPGELRSLATNNSVVADSFSRELQADLSAQNAAVANSTSPKNITRNWEVTAFDREAGLPEWAPNEDQVYASIDGYAGTYGNEWDATASLWTRYSNADLRKAGVAESTIRVIEDLRGQEGDAPKGLDDLLVQLYEANRIGDSRKALEAATAIRTIANLDPNATQVTQSGERTRQQIRAQAEIRSAFSSDAVGSTALAGVSLEELLPENYQTDGLSFFDQSLSTTTGPNGEIQYELDSTPILTDPRVVSNAYNKIASMYGISGTFVTADPDAALRNGALMYQNINSLPDTPLKAKLLEKWNTNFGNNLISGSETIAELTGGLYTPTPYSEPSTDIYNIGLAGEEGRMNWSNSAYSYVFGTSRTAVNGMPVTETIGDTETVTARSLVDLFNNELRNYYGNELYAVGTGRGIEPQLEATASDALQNVEANLVYGRERGSRLSNLRSFVKQDRYPEDYDGYKKAYATATKLDAIRSLPLDSDHPLMPVKRMLQNMTDAEAHSFFIVGTGMPFDDFGGRGAFTPSDANLGGFETIPLAAPDNPTQTIRQIDKELADIERAMGRAGEVVTSLGAESRVTPYEVDVLPGPGTDPMLLGPAASAAVNTSLGQRRQTLAARRAVLSSTGTIDSVSGALNDALFASFTGTKVGGKDIESSFQGAVEAFSSIYGKIIEGTDVAQIGQPKGFAGPLVGELKLGQKSSAAMFQQLVDRVGDAAGQLIAGQSQEKSADIIREAKLAMGRFEAQILALAEAPWVASLQTQGVADEVLRKDLEAMKFDDMFVNEDNPEANFARATMLAVALRRTGRL